MTDLATRVEGLSRWSWGYTDGIPGTPEYEPAPMICNWCGTVRSRCQCDSHAALRARAVEDGA